MSCLMYRLTNQEFLELIQRSSSIKDVLIALEYKNTGGGNRVLFRQRCEELGIDWKKEFRTKRWNRTKRTIENTFCENSTAPQTTVRDWYIKGNYSPYCCAICGINSWLGEELILRLDHINGNHRDSRLENLRWLCPNCDSQQDTYCGRNIKYPNRDNPNKCIDCGKIITNNKKVHRCRECYRKSQQKVVNRPTKEQLYQELKETNFVQVEKNME